MSTPKDHLEVRSDATKPVRSFHVAFIWSLCGILFLLAFLSWCTYVSNPAPPDFAHIPVKAAATCTEKLGQMDNVITLWAERNGKGAMDQPAAAEVAGYFKGLKLPVCEEGGTYTLGTLAIGTTCSIHGHAQMDNSGEHRDFAHETVIIPRHRADPGAADISNLKAIDGAIQQWALENHKTGEVVITNLQVIANYLKAREFPFCPCGGKYNVTTVKANPTCTVRGHAL